MRGGCGAAAARGECGSPSILRVTAGEADVSLPLLQRVLAAEFCNSHCLSEDRRAKLHKHAAFAALLIIFMDSLTNELLYSLE